MLLSTKSNIKSAVEKLTGGPILITTRYHYILCNQKKERTDETFAEGNENERTVDA
jgi:hypothetical protein